MTWFKSIVRINETNYYEYFNCNSEGHVRFKLSQKYGNGFARRAIVLERENTFKAYNVSIQFKHVPNITKISIMAIEPDHVKAIIYKQYTKREIKKLIIE